MLQAFTESFNNSTQQSFQKGRQKGRQKVPCEGQSQVSFALLYDSHPKRGLVERFICEGFAQSYGASIQVTMPEVLALQKKRFKAALGIRGADQPLFIEQYLPLPIEAFLAQQSPASLLKRSEIAEIGHLYSNSSNFTLSLLIATAMLLHAQDYKIMCFAATSALLDLFSKFGLSPQYLAPADPTLLTPSAQQWGTYYDTQPRVMALSLSDVMQLIHLNPLFSAMADELVPQIKSLMRQAQEAA